MAVPRSTVVFLSKRLFLEHFTFTEGLTKQGALQKWEEDSSNPETLTQMIHGELTIAVNIAVTHTVLSGDPFPAET